LADPHQTLQVAEPPPDPQTDGDAPAPRVVREPGRLTYVPALDGLRGLAVGAVLLFHAQLLVGDTWIFRGGYLGVSTFFTLSGFLITSILLLERESTGAIDGRRFWSRRFRRLLPAAWVTLAATVVWASGALAFIGFDAAPAQLRSLRGDLLASLAQVANWRFVLDSQSYGALFDEPSPVLHFWSLAIEEQFYVLFPLFAIGLLAASKGSRQVFGVAIATLTGLSLGATLIFGWSNDRIYFGTDTRASELLLGALLAVLVTTRSRVGRSHSSTIVAVVGGVALAVTALLWLTSPQSSDWLYHGGFTLYAVGTVAIILAATQPTGVVPALLSWSPLVALGRISYGVYLYHWLVYLWIDEGSTGLSSWPLLGVRLAVTLPLAALSYRYLEQPIRRRQGLGRGAAIRWAPVAAVALVVAVVAVTVDPPAPTIDFEAAQAELQEIPIEPVAAAEDGVRQPPRIAVFGDSTALMTGMGLTNWMHESREAVVAGGVTELGCGLGRGGERRTTPFDAHSIDPACDAWPETWGAIIDHGHPDLAVVQVSPWEVADRKLAGDDTWRSPGDPVYDQFLLSEMVAAIDLLARDGATVVWLTAPFIGEGEAGDEVLKRGDAADPTRMMRINELIRDAVAQRPEQATVVELASYLYERDDDTRLRPDGVHFSMETSVEVAYDWLGPELLDVYEERRAPSD
jgi:peptidoglycan/LPS O-acetylase OafA/YrhL